MSSKDAILTAFFEGPLTFRQTIDCLRAVGCDEREAVQLVWEGMEALEDDSDRYAFETGGRQ